MGFNPLKIIDDFTFCFYYFRVLFKNYDLRSLFMVPLSSYIMLSTILFFIGLTGVLVRRNIIIMMVSIEIMLNASNLALVAFNRFRFYNSNDGMIFSFLVIAIAAAEVAVGLAIVIAIYRKKKTVMIQDLSVMKH